MTRKRFIKLGMAQTSKRAATFAADYIVKNIRIFESYQKAYDRWDGYIGGRFERYVNQRFKIFG